MQPWGPPRRNVAASRRDVGRCHLGPPAEPSPSPTAQLPATTARNLQQANGPVVPIMNQR